MTAVVEFDDGDYAEIGPAQNKIRHQLFVSSSYGFALRIIAIDVNQLRQCDLNKDLMLGIEAQQPLIQRLFSRTQQLARCHRPRSVRERLTEKRFGTLTSTHWSPQSS